MKSMFIHKEVKSDFLEIREWAHRDEMLAVVVWSDATWTNKKNVSLRGGRHGVTPIHDRSGKANRKARPSWNAEV